MERFDIAVMDGKETKFVARDVVLRDRQALWSQIGRVARTFNRPGRLIRVTNAAGGIVVLIGVFSALRLYAELNGGAPPL